jgi:hypothetical protein
MSKGVTVQATVRIEVELTESAWGGDGDLAQVYKQAKEGALSKLQSALSAGGGRSVRIIGTPKVTAVLVPEGDE